MELSDRKLKILSAVVDSYVKFGEPVSSKSICNLLNFSISSATVRNELAELTELGLLEQPYTSAGRIPSHLGYRLYINKLMNRSFLSADIKNYIDMSFKAKIKTPDELLKTASRTLSCITNYAVVFTDVFSVKNSIKKIHLVQISTYHAMIILATSSGIIKTQIFKCNFKLSTDSISLFIKILNEKFIGILLDNITPALIQTVAISLGELAFLMSDVLNALLEVSAQATKTTFHLDSQTNLLFIPEFKPQLVANVVNFFYRSANMRDFLISQRTSKTRILIGRENPCDSLFQSSFIFTRYTMNKEIYGMLGIIGPTRMNYSNLISKLEYVAALVGKLLNKLLELE